MDDRGPGFWTIFFAVFLAIMAADAVRVSVVLSTIKHAFDNPVSIGNLLPKPPHSPRVDVRPNRPYAAPSTDAAPVYDQRPLQPGESCIEHQRIKREGNTLRRVGSC